jgi:outer membrane protein
VKKITLSSALLVTLASPLTHADTILGVYAGAGIWTSDYDGSAGEPSITLKDLGVKQHANNYYYIALEHPIPMLPNIRLAHTSIFSKQTADIQQVFTINGTDFIIGDTIKSDINLTYTDATLYYEILDNWINFDLGITARKFDGHVSGSSTTDTAYVKIDKTLPMIYGKLQFDLPFTGLSFGVDGNLVNYQDNKVNDYSAKLTYLYDTVLDIGFEAGYRKMSVTVDQSDLKAKAELKGPYAAFIAHF